MNLKLFQPPNVQTKALNGPFELELRNPAKNWQMIVHTTPS